MSNDWIDQTQQVVGAADVIADTGDVIGVPGAGTIGEVTSGAGGALNLIEGVQEGNPVQALAGSRGVGGAFITYTQWSAYNATYGQAIANGVSAEMADAIAQQAAQQAGSAGFSGAVSQVLPWIGVGLGAYSIYQDLANGDGPGAGTFIGVSGILASTVNPLFIAPAVLAFVSNRWEEKPRTMDEVHWWDTQLQVIGQSGDTVYLVDNRAKAGSLGFQADSDTQKLIKNSSDRFYSYNTQTNELQALGYAKKSGRNSEQTIGYVYDATIAAGGSGTQEAYQLRWSPEKQQFAVLAAVSPEMGSTRQSVAGYINADLAVQYFSGELDAAGILASVGAEMPEDGSAPNGLAAWTSYSDNMWFVDYDYDDGQMELANPQMLQAQIYNEVLLPQGLAPAQELTSIVLQDGTTAQVDSAGGLYDSDGKVIGYVNENGQAYSLSASHFSGIGDNGLDPMENKPLGSVNDWETVAATALGAGAAAGGALATGLTSQNDDVTGALQLGDESMETRTVDTSEISSGFKVPGADYWANMGQVLLRMIKAPTATSGKGPLKMVAAGEEAAKKTRIAAMQDLMEMAGKAYLTGLQGEYELAATGMKEAGATERTEIMAEAQLKSQELTSDKQLQRLLTAFGADVFKDVMIGPDGLAWLRIGTEVFKWGEDVWDKWTGKDAAPELDKLFEDYSIASFDADAFASWWQEGESNTYSMDSINLDGGWSDVDLGTDWDFGFGDDAGVAADLDSDFWWMTEED